MIYEWMADVIPGDIGEAFALINLKKVDGKNYETVLRQKDSWTFL